MSLFSLLLTAGLVWASAEPTLKFQYVPHDGAEAILCKHKPVRDLPDFDVHCEAGGIIKDFAAHVIVRELPAASSLEILYWVTERQAGSRPLFHSTTALLRGKGRASAISLSQGVENDFASLVMDWRAEP